MVITAKETEIVKQIALLFLAMACLSLTAFAAEVPRGDVFGGLSIDHISETTNLSD